MTISTYNGLSQSVVLNALLVIKEALQNNIASLTTFKVVALDVTAISEAIIVATPAIGTPGQAREVRAVATQEIETGIRDCDDFLLLIDDMLISEYEYTNNEMVIEYRLSRELQPIGTHHTGVHATCKDSITMDLLEGVLLNF